jgi:hypothetical protein
VKVEGRSWAGDRGSEPRAYVVALMGTCINMATSKLWVRS